MYRILLLALVVVGSTACRGGPPLIPGTKVPQTRENEEIIKRVEEYRTAVEQRNALKLLRMASPDYWEDGGTPGGEDDYGFKDLRRVLKSRFQQAKSIRYSMRYMRIRRQGSRAFVDVLIDASYTIRDADGRDLRRDMRDQNQLVLTYDGSKEQWFFLSGF